MVAAQRGRLAEVLPPEAPVAALSKLDRAFRGALELVGYFESADGAVAMFCSWHTPDLYVALRYSGIGEAGRSRYFALHSFSATLNKAAQCPPLQHVACPACGSGTGLAGDGGYRRSGQPPVPGPVSADAHHRRGHRVGLALGQKHARQTGKGCVGSGRFCYQRTSRQRA